MLGEVRIRLCLSFNHRRCSVRKGVLGNFTKFTGKHLYQTLFFNKVAGLRLSSLRHGDAFYLIFALKIKLRELKERKKKSFSFKHILTCFSVLI